MIELERLPNDLNKTPLIFGIKGRYVMIFILLLIIIVILGIVGAVIFFFNHKIGFAILTIFSMVLCLFFLGLYFRHISNKKKFSELKKTSDVLTNFNLKKFLE